MEKKDINKTKQMLNTKKLSEIIKQWEKGNHNLYVYSYDHKSGKVVSGKITWVGYTRRNTNIIRVHLDNDKYIDCTPDHLFMLRDGSYIKKINIKEFREKGFLQEVNRLFFHPLGLALEVIIDDETKEEKLGGIWDYRDDAEGIIFGDNMINQKKIDYILNLKNSKRDERFKLFGDFIQEN